MTQTNGFDPTTVKRFVGDIQRHNEELLSLRGEYMARCKTVREHIKDVKDRATDAGIPRKALNTLLKKMDLEAKIEGLTEDFDEDEEVSFEALEAALGDFAGTPLGEAAVDKAEKRRARKSEAADSLTSK